MGIICILEPERFYRSCESTNQRIAFDIDCSCQHLGTGGQDGLVHIYDLQTGQWVSGFQAAADTVNGFSFHHFLPMAVSSSGHRRFQNLEDDDDGEDLQLRGDENCASVWSFSYYVTAGEQSRRRVIFRNIENNPPFCS